MAKVKLVFTDSGDNFLIGEELVKSISIDGVDIEFEYFRNNRKPLPEVFNSVLDHERKSGNPNDHVVFFHGDVLLDIRKFIIRLLEINDKYDLVGLAGTKKIDTSKSPLNWFTGSNPTPEERYGDITMTIGGKETRRCFYNSEKPDVIDTRVACIDGLCMAFNRKMLESDIRFGIKTDFNCYDTFISLESIINYKFRVGVIVMQTIHTSVGRSILTDHFLKEERLLRDHFGL